MTVESKVLPVHSLDVRDLSTKTVIVYTDRAEVKRLIRLEHLAVGKSLIRINNVSPVIERQSIRVEGQMPAKILEVCFEEIPLVNNNVAIQNLQLSELENEKSSLEFARTSLRDQIDVLEKRLEVLDGVAKQIGQNVLISSDIELVKKFNHVTTPASTFLLCEDSMKNLTNFLDYYGRTASEMRKELRDKECESAKLKERIDKLERELDQLRCKCEYDSHKRNISILVETEVTSVVELHLIYQVYCASWRPSYSLRASTSGMDADCSDSVTLAYYGMVEQKTDEDWCDAELILSTAVPCLPSSVPTLSTVNAMLHRQIIGFRPRNFSVRRKPISHGSLDDDAGIGSYSYHNELFTDAAGLQRIVEQPLASSHLNLANSSGSDNDSIQSAEQVPSTYFPIEMPVTVPSDGRYYKVNIASIELSPTFVHETVPSKVASAFITVVLKNTSTLPFLPGSLSIFLNNSFISTSHLKMILPDEEFSVLLGVDTSVKVEYKKSNPLEEQIGFMSKSALTTREQVISLRNAKVGQKAQITVREPIPKSFDEKIKVSVLLPDLKSSRGSETRLNKENHLEWVCTLAPGEQRDLVIKWTLEHPLNESVVFTTNPVPASRIH